MHEQTLIASLPYSLDEPKGEYVIVIEQGKFESNFLPSDEELLDELKSLMQTNSKNDSMRILKDKYKIQKSYIYNLYEKNK